MMMMRAILPSLFITRCPPSREYSGNVRQHPSQISASVSTTPSVKPITPPNRPVRGRCADGGCVREPYPPTHVAPIPLPPQILLPTWYALPLPPPSGVPYYLKSPPGCPLRISILLPDARSGHRPSCRALKTAPPPRVSTPAPQPCVSPHNHRTRRSPDAGYGPRTAPIVP